MEKEKDQLPEHCFISGNQLPVWSQVTVKLRLEPSGLSSLTQVILTDAIYKFVAVSSIWILLSQVGIGGHVITVEPKTIQSRCAYDLK